MNIVPYFRLKKFYSKEIVKILNRIVFLCYDEAVSVHLNKLVLITISVVIVLQILLYVFSYKDCLKDL